MVNAAGAEAGRISAMLGIELPIQGHPIQVNVTEPVAPLVKHLVYFAGEKLTLKQAQERLASSSAAAGPRAGARAARSASGPPSISHSLRSNLDGRSARGAARSASVRLLRVWPAIVNGTADWKPILGEVPGLPGFFMNMFPWMGFTAGPISRPDHRRARARPQAPPRHPGFSRALRG